MMEMKERKYVKYRVDMYEDTKFKIIDTKPERDVMHYVWNRILLLAGKVNLEGDLYLSKNIPYTIETLAIEFNRDIAKIKLALDVFIDLEMIEITEDNIYRVKNFAKHQNIKVKEKSITKNKEDDVKSIEVNANDNSKVITNEDEDKESDNKINENEVENLEDVNGGSLEITNEDINKVNDENSSGNVQVNDPIILETNKSKKNNKKKKRDKSSDINTIDEEFENNSICCLTDGVRPLGEGERNILEWSFG
jgi:predicted phage replisome organizer